MELEGRVEVLTARLWLVAGGCLSVVLSALTTTGWATPWGNPTYQLTLWHLAERRAGDVVALVAVLLFAGVAVAAFVRVRPVGTWHVAVAIFGAVVVGVICFRGNVPVYSSQPGQWAAVACIVLLTGLHGWRGATVLRDEQRDGGKGIETQVAAAAAKQI